MKNSKKNKIKEEKIAGIGINTKGHHILFKSDSSTSPYYIGLNLDNNDLVELILTDGITAANCRGNHLTELVIPKSMMYIECDKELFDYNEYPSEEVYVEIFYTDEKNIFEFE